MDCSQAFHPFVMDFDHRPGVEKLFAVSAMLSRSISEEAVLAEIAKCDLVCANCHRLRTLARLEKTRLPVPEAAPRKTHCPHGHEYTAENTRPRGKAGRSCRRCDARGRNRCKALPASVDLT
jgi:hypothetical protein